MALSGNNDTTFFASVFSKFTKEVGRMVMRRVRAWRQRTLQNASRELSFHARRAKNAKSRLEKILLKRREKRSEIQERFYQSSLNAARNQVYAERIQCMKYWRILEGHDALPINSLNGKRWDDFDEFLAHWQSSENRKTKVYA